MRAPDHLQLGPGLGRPLPQPHARDLFPLPHLSVPDPVRGIGRRAAQRLQRKRKVALTANEGIDTLNWLNGKIFDDALPLGGRPPDSLQQEVLDRVVGLAESARDLGKASVIPTAEAALAALLRGRSDYKADSANAALAPYNLELISLPEWLEGAPSIESLLGKDDRRYLEDEERMLKDKQDVSSEDLPEP